MRKLLSPIAIIAAIQLVGCSYFPEKWHGPPPQVRQTPPRDVGEFLLTHYTTLMNGPECAMATRRPLPALEDQQLEPTSIAAGERFTHSLVYTVCADNLDQFVSGTVYRKVYFRDRLLHSEPKPHDLKPGRWQIKAVIEVPAFSTPGMYELRTEFVGNGSHSGRIHLQKISKFEVKG